MRARNLLLLAALALLPGCPSTTDSASASTIPDSDGYADGGDTGDTGWTTASTDASNGDSASDNGIESTNTGGLDTAIANNTDEGDTSESSDEASDSQCDSESIGPQAGDTCDLARTASMGGNAGNTAPLQNDYTFTSCSPTSGADEVWRFTAPKSGTYRVTMDASARESFPCMVSLLADCATAPTPEQNDVTCGRADPYQFWATIEFKAEALQTVYLVAEGLAEALGGEYLLTIEQLAAPPVPQCETPPATCEDIGDELGQQHYGCCAGGVVYWCGSAGAAKGLTLSTEDCAAKGKVCNYNALLGYLWCE